MKLLKALLIILLVGVISLLCQILRAQSRSLDQVQTLTRIAKDAMQYRATPARVHEKIQAELGISVDLSPEDSETVVLPKIITLFDMGERWIVRMKTGPDGRCEQVWLELQPVGYL